MTKKSVVGWLLFCLCAGFFVELGERICQELWPPNLGTIEYIVTDKRAGHDS